MFASGGAGIGRRRVGRCRAGGRVAGGRVRRDARRRRRDARRARRAGGVVARDDRAAERGGEGKAEQNSLDHLGSPPVFRAPAVLAPRAAVAASTDLIDLAERRLEIPRTKPCSSLAPVECFGGAAPRRATSVKRGRTRRICKWHRGSARLRPQRRHRPIPAMSSTRPGPPERPDMDHRSRAGHERQESHR